MYRPYGGDGTRNGSSNVAHYERAVRELPSANLSITLPILLIGLEQDAATPVINVKECQFPALKDIVGKGNNENRWRVVNGLMRDAKMSEIGPDSDVGPMLVLPEEEADETPGKSAT